MSKILNIAQIVTAIILMILVLIQNRGGGLSEVFGGSETSNAYRTKRGMERSIFIATIIFSIIFLGLSITAAFFVK